MKKMTLMIIMVPSIIELCSCIDYLDVSLKQVLDDNLLNKPEDVDGFVATAYTRITDIPSWDSPFTPWRSDSIRSDNPYKGGGSIWDGGGGWGYIEVFVDLTPNEWPLDYPWYVSYQIAQQCNTALQELEGVTIDVFPAVDSRRGEMLFLRSSVYLRLKELFKYIPYIDESMKGTTANFEAILNRDKTRGNDQYLWEHILTDFKKAEELLPITQEDKGHITKNTATAMVTRILMFMVYEQDDRHQVVNINKECLQEALIYPNESTGQEGGALDLRDDFGTSFVPESDNLTKESIWGVRYSINDNSRTGGKVNHSEGLSHSW